MTDKDVVICAANAAVAIIAATNFDLPAYLSVTLFLLAIGLGAMNAHAINIRTGRYR